MANKQEERQGFPADIPPELTEYKAFARLATNDDFIMWRRLAEDFQMKRAYNFIAGSDFPKDIKDPREYMRGGYDLYVKMFRVIDRAEEMIISLTEDNEKKQV